MTDGVSIAIIGALASVASAALGAVNARKIKEIHAEVKTGNSLRLGEMADDAETRRIADIMPSERTNAEDDHIATIPEKKKPKRKSSNNRRTGDVK